MEVDLEEHVLHVKQGWFGGYACSLEDLNVSFIDALFGVRGSSPTSPL